MTLIPAHWWQYFAPRVEDVSFRAPSLWRARPRTIATLIAGLAVFGTGESLLVRSNFGAAPWTVLATGIAHSTGLSLGWATFVVSCVVFSTWWPLGQRPGLGSVANITVVPIFLEIGYKNFPEAHAGWIRVLMMLGGLSAICVGGAFYLSCAMGTGPRDGLMVGLGRRLNLPIARLRTGIELAAMALGIALGGAFGVGTVVFALAVGPVLSVCLRTLGRLFPSSTRDLTRQ
jgi:uncharacterized membrane protein YczE